MPIIDTPQGRIEVLPPPISLLQQLRALLPFGLCQFDPPQQGVHFGIVMQCGCEEVHCIKQQPVELEKEGAMLSARIQHIMCIEALCRYVRDGFTGAYIPGPYLRQRNNGLWEAGVAHFVFPSTTGIEAQEFPFRGAFDNRFGHGTTTMLEHFTQHFMAAFRESSLTPPGYFGLDVRPRLHLGSLLLNLMCIGPHVLYLQANLLEHEDPAWALLANRGISRVFHLPSVPFAIESSDLAVTKGTPRATTDASGRTANESMKSWPANVRPLPGCKILIDAATNQPYSMPIRSLDRTVESAVPDCENAQSWYRFALETGTLSKDQQLACLQRAVLIDGRFTRAWWSLGCSYELEGKDWYGAANAFNHVVFLEPDHPAAWFSLAQLWAARGIMPKAQEAYARFKELQPNNGAS